MALQYGTALRAAQVGQIQGTVGEQAKVVLYSGSAPANCAAAATGTAIATITVGNVWLSSDGVGAVYKAGTWEGVGNSNAGSGATATHWRLWNNGQTVCHMQGTVTATGGGGDMEINNVVIANGQTVVVTAFTVTAGNS